MQPLTSAVSHFLFAAFATSAIHAMPLAQDPLPEVFDAERGLVTNEAGAFEGYTLFAPLMSDKVYLVDMDGTVVHRWTGLVPPGGGMYLLDSGNLLRCGRDEENPRFHGGGIGGYLQEIDWAGKVVWEYTLSNDSRVQHHDVEPLANGNLLVIAWEHHTAEEAIAHGRDPDAVGEEGFWADVVLEIEPTRPSGGKVVWEWRAWDRLIQDFDPKKQGYGSIPEHPGRVDINADHRDQPPLTTAQREKLAKIERDMRALGYAGGEDDEDEYGEKPAESDDDKKRKREPDWLHTNSVKYDAELDLIVLSTPHLCEIWVIDHSTTTAQAAGRTGGNFGMGGDLLYRWGNPRNYGAGKASDKVLDYQHNPTWVAGEGLRVLLYNNGMHRDDKTSTAIELALPFVPGAGFQREPGAAFGPAQPVWSYAAGGARFSPFISGAQRLPNGNTLICSGVPGCMFEVTHDGEIVWEYLNPFGGEIKASKKAPPAPPKSVFRATRIAADHPGLAGKI